MKDTITAILTGYNRPQNMNAIADAVAGQSIPPEDVWVWYNKGAAEQEELDWVKGAYCTYNFGFFGRFAMALMAQTEYVAIFDDDTVPGDKWFENCLNTMDKTPGILGTVGVYLHGPRYQGHERVGWPAPNEEAGEVDLVGHCWFMRRKDVKWMFVEDPPRWTNGEDIHLSATALRLGGVKTIVPPHPPNNTSMWGSIHGNYLGMDKAASSLQNTRRHSEQRDAVVREEIKRGWVPLHMRRNDAGNNEVSS